MKIIILLSFSILTFINTHQAEQTPKPSLRKEKLAAIYTAEIGVRELSGKNDGKRIEEYLKYVGLKKGNPWCAAFMCWALGKAGIPNPRSGYCPDLFPAARVTWTRSRIHAADSPAEPQKGDVFGLFFPEKHRVAHVGFIDHWGPKYAITIEGNTNAAGSREGDGVYRKRRLIQSIYIIARY